MPALAETRRQGTLPHVSQCAGDSHGQTITARQGTSLICCQVNDPNTQLSLCTLPSRQGLSGMPSSWASGSRSLPFPEALRGPIFLSKGYAPPLPREIVHRKFLGYKCSLPPYPPPAASESSE